METRATIHTRFYIFAHAGKKQLFALLGPNGAGKTTTISMLTGALPPTRGNALVLGETIAHPAGIALVRKNMGVCPQVRCMYSTCDQSYVGFPFIWLQDARNGVQSR
jgi:ABC-type branched-subunit amino acid transport system ATPase component